MNPRPTIFGRILLKMSCWSLLRILAKCELNLHIICSEQHHRWGIQLIPKMQVLFYRIRGVSRVFYGINPSPFWKLIQNMPWFEPFPSNPGYSNKFKFCKIHPKPNYLDIAKIQEKNLSAPTQIQPAHCYRYLVQRSILCGFFSFRSCDFEKEIFYSLRAI